MKDGGGSGSSGSPRAEALSTRGSAPPLQPLRIPAGWHVSYNDFREVDPTPEAIEADLLREDLLQLVLNTPKRIVDLGWYGGAEGTYGVICCEPDFLGKTLADVRCASRVEAVAAIEGMLERFGRGGRR
ncbi:MAG: hypothetical protein U0441_05410 [Polyangiaceae bacterium]